MIHHRQGYQEINTSCWSGGWKVVPTNTWTHEENDYQSYCTEIVILDKNAGILSGTRRFVCDDATDCIYNHPDKLLIE